MEMHHLNLVAILVAAVATMVVGFIWYSPLLFAKPWMREMGNDPSDKERMEEMRKSAGPAYAGSFVAGLRVYAGSFPSLDSSRSEHFGLMVGFHVWLGFVATVQLTNALFTKQSMKLFAINTGYQPVCYLVMSAILVAWK